MDTQYFFAGDETAKVSTTSIEIKPSGSYWINRQSVPEILSISEWEASEITEVESIVKYRKIERTIFLSIPFIMLVFHILASHDQDKPSPYSTVFWVLVMMFFMATAKFMYTETKLRDAFQRMLTRTGSEAIHVSPTLNSKYGLWTSRQRDEELLSLLWKEDDVSKVQELVAERSVAGKRYHYSLFAFLVTNLLSYLSMIANTPWVAFGVAIAALIGCIIFLFYGLYNLNRLRELNQQLHSLAITSIVHPQHHGALA